MTPAAEEEFDHALLLTELEATEHWAGGGFLALESEVRAQPEDVAAMILRKAGSRRDPEVVIERTVSLASHWEVETRRPLLFAIAVHGVEAAGWLVRASLGAPDDPVDLVPPTVLLEAAAGQSANAEWSAEILDTVIREWRWPTIAVLLDAAAASGFDSDWLSRGLDDATWARANPAPTVDRPTGGTVPLLEAEWARVPYEQLFSADDDRVTLAAAHAAQVIGTAESWQARDSSPDSWLNALATDLPGCGQPTCCRPGLFEVALLHRGYDLRARRYRPSPVARRPSLPEARDEDVRFNRPEPPGPSIWKTLFRLLSRH